MAIDTTGARGVNARLSLCFIDTSFDFDVATPFEQPLGGSHSAMCYVAVELARRGHQITLLSRTSRPRTIMGVECLNVEVVAEGFLNARLYDAAIVLNGPAELSEWRFYLSKETDLVLWNQHAVDQPAIQGLSRRNVRKKWDRIACVSEWHRRSVIEAFRIEPERTLVMRNAISPPFENLFASPSDLKLAKGEAAVLVYTSTPFRGLDVLLDVYPQLHAEWPDASLEIYSSMRVYQTAADADPYAPLYAQARGMPAVKYIGSLSQTDLAASLRSASVLSYPNTFAETSCISVIEAMAAGLHVVSTALGALPETSMGFADLVAPLTGANDRNRFATDFRQRVRAVLEERAMHPDLFAERCFARATEINRHYTWAHRAAEWETAILEWRATRQAEAMVSL
jgi:glycosyltransferase involved in cell wall biosynthesis